MNWKNSKSSLVAALIFSWVFAGVFVTPFCGAIFHCGCTWLWAGAASRCVGIMSAGGIHHDCPWCSDAPTGMLVPAVAIVLAQTALIVLLWWKYRARIWAQLAAGIVAFLVAGYVEASIHGWISKIF